LVRRRSFPERADISLTETNSRKEFSLLHYVAVFLVIALIAALFGFGGIAASDHV
jgi:hypothetical protein